MANNKYASVREFQMLRDEVGVLFKKVDKLMINDIPHLQTAIKTSEIKTTETLTEIVGEIKAMKRENMLMGRGMIVISFVVVALLIGLNGPQIMALLGGLI